MAREAVGLLALRSFITVATVMIGWRGNCSKRRTAATDRVSFGAQPAVVVVAVPLEEEAQVQERRRQELPVLEEQRDQQSSDAAVAVEVGVNGLELNVEQSRAHERR